MTTNWKEYTGTDEQIAEMTNAINGYLVNLIKVSETDIQHGDPNFAFNMDGVISYWIIPDDPLREMKIRQAQTGQPVWISEPINDNYDGAKYITTTPNWNIPNAEYSFKPFEE